MKKILFTIAIVLTMTMSANAQIDPFIESDYSSNIDRTDDILPFLPIWGVGAYDNDQSALPLGNGLIILATLGAGYALRRAGKKE